MLIKMTFCSLQILFLFQSDILALEGVTGNLKCGGLNEDLLNCDDDSVLFENKTLSSHLSEPLIMKFPLLLAIMTRHKDIFSYCQMLRICNLDITTGLIVVNANSREHQRSKTSYIYSVVKNTIHYLWHKGGGLDVLGNLNHMPYLVSNVTSFSIGYNDFRLTKNSPCSKSIVYPNNMEQLDLSNTPMGNLSCSGLLGISHLRRFVCCNCGITGWPEGFYRNFTIKHLELTGNSLGALLQGDKHGRLFNSVTGVEELYIGEQLGGIEYFTDSTFLFLLLNLTDLDLHSNELTKWNISIARNSKLKYLDLTNNNITSIEKRFRKEFDAQFLKTGFKINLVGNDINCTEANTEYIEWLLNSLSIYDKRLLRCAQSNELLSDFYRQQSQPITTSTKLRKRSTATRFLTTTIYSTILRSSPPPTTTNKTPDLSNSLVAERLTSADTGATLDKANDFSSGSTLSILPSLSNHTATNNRLNPVTTRSDNRNFSKSSAKTKDIVTAAKKISIIASRMETATARNSLTSKARFSDTLSSLSVIGESLKTSSPAYTKKLTPTAFKDNKSSFSAVILIPVCSGVVICIASIFSIIWYTKRHKPVRCCWAIRAHHAGAEDHETIICNDNLEQVSEDSLHIYDTVCELQDVDSGYFEVLPPIPIADKGNIV